jgi:hypothetical protein
MAASTRRVLPSSQSSRAKARAEQMRSWSRGPVGSRRTAPASPRGNGAPLLQAAASPLPALTRRFRGGPGKQRRAGRDRLVRNVLVGALQSAPRPASMPGDVAGLEGDHDVPQRSCNSSERTSASEIDDRCRRGIHVPVSRSGGTSYGILAIRGDARSDGARQNPVSPVGGIRPALRAVGSLQRARLRDRVSWAKRSPPDAYGRRRRRSRRPPRGRLAKHGRRASMQAQPDHSPRHLGEPRSRRAPRRRRGETHRKEQARTRGGRSFSPARSRWTCSNVRRARDG